MKAFDNIYKLHGLLKEARHPVSFGRIREELRCSAATAHRAINDLRDFLGAPIERQKHYPRGYRYTNKSYELPGLWFTAIEVQALLLIVQLLSAFEPGILGIAIAPMRDRLLDILSSQGITPDDRSRMRLLRATARPTGPHFGTVASGLLQRKRLRIRYHARGNKQVTERDISPQRLTHYRDNWYLDAWCHLRQELRTFSVDRILTVEVLAEKADDISNTVLDRHFGATFGIMSGEATDIARLIFTAAIADWIETQEWHPKQKGRRLENGDYELEFPIGPRLEELVLEVLRYGPDVKVQAPQRLQDEVLKKLKAAVGQYEVGA